MSDVYEYLVLDVRDKSGSVNIDQLTKLLNQYGQQGWHLVSAYTNEMGKNAVSIGGIGLNSTVDQNILIMERKLQSANNSTSSGNNQSYERKKEMRVDSYSKLQDEKNKETIKEYINTQLEKTEMSDIYKFQELYFGTSSLAYMKELVPDVTGFSGISDYKTALQKVLKDL